jgi:hypothetical protein
MAKKRGGGGGSNLPLIMTLVFFILSTVILGVTTYMGYNEVDKAKEGEKKAQGDAKKKGDEAEWYRFQARVYRAYIGQPMKGYEAPLLASQKDQFDKGSLSFANGAEGADDVKNFLASVKNVMPWNAPGDISPSATYDSRLAEKEQQYATRTKERNQMEAERDKAREDVRTKEADLKAAEEKFDAQVVKFRQAADAERKANEALLQKLRADLKGENEAKGNALRARADAEKGRDTAEKLLKTEKGRLTEAVTRGKRLKEEKDEAEEQLRVFNERFGGVDPKVMEAERQDARQRDILRGWTKPWHIVALDSKGMMPYISLGSADGLKPHVTFSIYGVGQGGSLKLTPKGTLEVVRIVGPHLAQARITSHRDSRGNLLKRGEEAQAEPILKGDKVVNTTWNQRRRVAIAGLADLGGEGLESSADFRRLLEKQKVDVDAYIDTRGKMPKLVGDVTSKTDYLVVGDTLDGVKHEKARDKAFVAEFEKLTQELTRKAQANGVTVLNLRRYLDMIGYQPPRVLSGSTSD